MRNLGADRFWRGGLRPYVAAYAERCERVPAVREAVLDWPGAIH